MTHTNTYESSEGLFRFNEISSTNDMARQLWNDGIAKHKDCVVARFQTAGRGQSGSIWSSDPDRNLLFSIILEPSNNAIEKQIFLNMTVALATFRFILEEGMQQVSIKWPNDILIGCEKVAGILIENLLGQDGIKLSVAGLGVNVNQRIFQGVKATSLVLQDGMERDPEHCLHALRKLLNEEISLFDQGMYQVIRQRFNKHLFRQGQVTEFLQEGRSMFGKVIGADEAGRLELEAEGVVKHFHNKEIQWVL